MLQGERGAREAVRLTLAWARIFARWSPFAWDPDILSRRAYNLACAAMAVMAQAHVAGQGGDPATGCSGGG